MARRQPSTDSRPRGAGGAFRRRAALLLPGLLAAVVYANSIAGDFVWDDRRLILDDRAITTWSQLDEIFSNDFFSRSEDDLPYGYYRPLTTVSYLIDYSFWRLDPRGYHLTNVALHALCSSLVAVVLAAAGWSRTAAVAAGLLFAAHPIHTENVAWISGRTDVLAFAFGLAALWPWLGLRSRALAGATRWWSALALFAGLLAKEMAVVVLLWIAAAERIRQARPWPAIARDLLPHLVVTTAYLGLRFVVLDIGLPGAAPPEHTLPHLALTAPPTVARYLGWMAWPVELSAFVINPYVSDPSTPRLWLAVAGLCGCLAIGARFADRPSVRLAIVWLATSFLPLLNLVRVASPPEMGDTMAERFCYFPSFGFIALLVLAGEVFRRRSPRAAGAVAAAVLLALSWRSVTRNADWRDEMTFLKVTLAQAPNATLLWRNLAQLHLDRRELAAADEAVRRLEALRPDSVIALTTRAHYFVAAGRPAEAIALQTRLVKTAQRSNAMAQNNLAYLHRLTGNVDEARRILAGLVADGRAYGDVHYNLAEIHRAEGDLASARRGLRAAFADRPHSRRIGALLATLESEAGEHAAAARIYTGLLSVYRNDPRLLNNLAVVAYRSGERARALELWQAALRADAGYAAAALGSSGALLEQGATEAARAVLERTAGAVSSAADGEQLRRALAELPPRR